MKQITKTPEILARMKAAFGPDVDVANLAVYESVALNTLPLRKSSGLFKGARVTGATMSYIANMINKESAPLQAMHDTQKTPAGRMFYAEVVDDEMRALFTCTEAKFQEDIDKGTLDQTSVSFQPKHISCSACGFDYRKPDAWEARYTLTCDEGHVLGENGVFAWLDGCDVFNEYSLVGKGAVNGARIVGPSEAKLSSNEQFRLAASADGADVFGIVQLTATLKENKSVDLTTLLAKHEATLATSAEATVKLAAETRRADEAVASLTAANAELEKFKDVAPKLAKLEAAEADSTAAVAALSAEAKKIFIALGKPDEPLKTTVPELVAQIEENRSKLAAYVPIGGVSKPADKDPNLDASANAPRTNAFFTKKN